MDVLDIALPFYGRFDYLREAVDSVLAQDDPRWRLTVIDDVYPDTAPGKWVEAIADPRVTYLRNSVNLGVAGNFAKCLSSCTSERVVVLGGDDVLLPEYVRRVFELHDAFPEAGVIQPGVEVIDDGGTVYYPLVDRMKAAYRFAGSGAREFGGEQLAASLLRGNWAYFPALAWDRVAAERIGFRTDLIVAPDLVLLLDLAAEGRSLVLDDEVVFRYRRHRSSVSSTAAANGSRFVEERRMFLEQARRFAALGWARAARVARWHISSRLNALTRLPSAVRSGDREGIRVLIGHALRS